MRQRHKPWAIPFLESQPQYVSRFSNENHSFALPSAFSTIALEIGVGKGDFLMSMAQKNPNRYYVGIELQPSVLVIAVQKAIELALTNIHFIWGNASEVLPALSNHGFDIVYLNFSDPWPKKRHEKRRLTSNSYLQHYARLLQPAGRIIYKSDNEGFYLYSSEQFSNKPWRIVQIQSPYEFPDMDDATSEYEARFRSIGNPIHRLIIEKEEEVNDL